VTSPLQILDAERAAPDEHFVVNSLEPGKGVVIDLLTKSRRQG
jgi:hypothetical protein